MPLTGLSYNRGWQAGGHGHLVCTCSFLKPEERRLWLAGWLQGMADEGHEVPWAVKQRADRLRLESPAGVTWGPRGHESDVSSRDWLEVLR